MSLITIGSNTFNGVISVSTTGDSRTYTASGITTFSSTSVVDLGQYASDNNLIVAGAGNLYINGLVTGGLAGSVGVYRWSGSSVIGEMQLNNPNNNFAGDVIVSGGFLRVESAGALGAATDATSVRGSGGTLELRVTAANAGFTNKTLDAIAATTIYIGQQPGVESINQTVTFGGATVNGTLVSGYNASTASIAEIFSGNDGYGMTLNLGSTATLPILTGGTWGVADNLNGLLTFNGSISSLDTASRIYTITSTGDTLVTGNLLNGSSTLDGVWTKGGVGTLAIQGTASTNVGAFDLTTGTVAVNSLGGLNNGLGGLNMGSTTLNTVLNYLGASGTGAGQTSALAIDLLSTTGTSAIFANQQQNPANTAPTALVLTSSIASAVATSGAHALYLGGYNNSGSASVVNRLQGVLQDNSTASITSLVKGGSGTWLYAPAPSSYVTTAPTGITGAGAINTNVLTVSSASGLVVGESVTGTNVPGSSIITAISGNTIYLNNNIATAVASATALTFGTIGLAGAAGENFTGSVTVAGGTLQIQPTAASGNGSAPLGALAGAATTNNLIFTTDITTGSGSGGGYAGGTFQVLGLAAGGSSVTTTVGQLIPTAGAGTIVTTAIGTSAPTLDFMNTTPIGTRALGAVVDFAPGTGTTIEFNSAPNLTNGLITSPAATGVIATAYAYYTNPSGTIDFATTTGSGPYVVAPYTGYTTGLPASGSVGTANYLSNGSVVTTAAEGVNALQLAGSQTITLNGSLGIGTGGLLFDNSTGPATIASTNPIYTLGLGESVTISSTAGSAAVTLTAGSTFGFYVGMPISQTASIPAGETVASIQDLTHFTLSSGTGVTTITNSANIAGATEMVITVAGTNAANALTISAPIFGTSSSAVTKDGSGTLIIAGSNTYTGNTTINEGTIQLSGASASLGAITTTTNLTTVRQGATLDLNGAGPGGVVTIGGLAGAGTITNSGGGTHAASTLDIGMFGTTTASGLYTGLLTDGAGVLNVTKNGTGTQYLVPLNGAYQSTNSSAGGTVLAASVANGSATVGGLASTANLFVGEVVSGPNIPVGAAITSILDANDVLLSLAATGSANTSLTFGTSEATLGTIGYNTYSGVTTIAQGILSVTNIANYGSPSSIGTGLSVPNGQSLVLGSAAGGSNSGILQYTGGTPTTSMAIQAIQTPSVQTNLLFTLAGNGGLDSSGTYGTAGNLAGTANNAALWFTNTAPVRFSAPGSMTLTLQGTSTGDNEIDLRLINNTIDGAPLNVTKSGAGLWVLGNASNSYTGVTTISGGILRAQDGSSLPTASNLVFNSGVLETSGTFTRSLGAGAGQVQWMSGTANGGFAASSSPLVVAIGGVANPTTLVFGTASFTSGSLLLGSATSLADTTVLNPIDLNGATRTIAVTANASSGADIYTLSGVISGRTGSGLDLNGAATMLYIAGANTYSGNTMISGDIGVTSIGSGGPSSAFGDSTGQLYLGTGSTTGGYLLYTGPGETTTRTINLNTTTAGSTIDASGSGALVLDSIVNLNAGAKTLTLEGQSLANNTVNSVLADNNGSLTVVKTQSGNWTLAGANTYTGGTYVTGGNLGLTSNASLGVTGPTGLTGGNAASSTTITLTGASTTSGISVGEYVVGPGIPVGITVTGITGNTTFTISTAEAAMSTSEPLIFAPLELNTGGIFATSPLTITTPVVVYEGSTDNFSGTNSITFSGALTGSSGGAWTFYNMLASPAALTLAGGFYSFESATARVLAIDGTGNTVISGPIASFGGAVGMSVNVQGSLSMNYNNGASTAFTGGFTLTEGSLLLNSAGALGPSGNVVTLNGGTVTAGLTLTGTSKIVNPITIGANLVTFTGNNSIELGGTVGMAASRVLTNDLSGGASLLLSNANAISNTAASTLVLTGTGNTTISGAYVAGTLISGLTYSGIGSSTLTLQGTNTYYGATNLNGGATTLNGAAGEFGFLSTFATSALSTNTTTLNITGTADGLLVGQPVVGVGIPSGTTITAVAATTVTLSQAATTTAGESLNFGGTTGILVEPSASLTLDNTAANAGANRLGNHPLTLASGTLNFIGNSAGTIEGGNGTGSGNLILGSGQSTINFTSNGGTTELNFGALAKAATPAGGGIDIEGSTIGTATSQINIGSTATTTLASTSTTVTIGSTAGLFVGEAVSGAGIVPGATIATITSGNAFTLTLPTNTVAYESVASGT
ncbi:MAG TPA: autotransporter-associated beta strand repeat-containing protein, partial [Pirellulales bacterium]